MKAFKELLYTVAISSLCVILGFAFGLFVTSWRAHSYPASAQSRLSATACCGLHALAQMSAACSFTPAVTGAAAGVAYRAGEIATTAAEACNCQEKCNCDICYCNEHLSK